jgi:hypothetical protein
MADDEFIQEIKAAQVAPKDEYSCGRKSDLSRAKSHS